MVQKVSKESKIGQNVYENVLEFVLCWLPTPDKEVFQEVWLI